MARTDQVTFVHPSTSSHPPVGATEVSNRPQPIMHSSTSYLLSSSPPRHTNADNYSVTNSNPPTQATQAPTPTETTHQVQSQNLSFVHRSQGPNFGNSGQEPGNLSACSLPIASSDSIYGSTQGPRADVPGRPDAITNQEPTQSVLASLSDATSIYNLPTSTLERMVGEVIREEGFLQMVNLSELDTTEE